VRARLERDPLSFEASSCRPPDFNAARAQILFHVEEAF